MPEWKFKRGFGKVSKWTVLKFTGLALTVAFAININNTTNEIVREMTYESDSVRVVTAPPDSNVAAFVDSLTALVAEVRRDMGQPRDSVAIRYVSVPRDSVVTVPVNVPIFETVYRESTRWVTDTLEVEPEPKTAWELWGPGPRFP
jgi:hypothetical protein